MGVKFRPAKVPPPKAAVHERAYTARLVGINRMFADHVEHEARAFLANGGDVAQFKQNLTHAYAGIVAASGLGPWLDRFATGLWSVNNSYVKRVTKGALQGRRAVVARRGDAKDPPELPFEALFGGQSHRPEKVKVQAIQKIGGLKNANYLRTGYRPGSFDYVRAADPKALGPVRVTVSHKGEVLLEDGRHRLAIAQERGQSTIDAHVRQLNAAGDTVATSRTHVWTGVGEPPKVPPAAPPPRPPAPEPTHIILVAPTSRVPAQEIETFRRTNLSLIKGASDDQIDQLADVMRAAQNTGQRFEDTIGDIKERLGVGDSRARLIARDQTNKFNGDMARHTQTSAGISEYTWTTVDDLAVRGRPDGLYPKSKDNHWKLRNTVHSWDSPPDVGNGRHYHPGQDIQCRCQAVPHVPFFD